MILNSDITRDEIKNVIANLKNNKASGYDDVLNEHIKCTVDIMLPIYQKLFNLVLNSLSYLKPGLRVLFNLSIKRREISKIQHPIDL